MAIEKVQKEKINHSYFYSLELEGINCFKDKQVLDLSDGKENYSPWTIILGDNGTGKTTLLRILDRMQPINEYPEEGRPHSISRLMIRFFASKNFDIRLKTITKNDKVDYSVKRGNEKNSLSKITISNLNTITNNFIISYGASRRMSKAQKISEKEIDIDKMTSLFDESIELINAEEWFLQKFLTSIISDEKNKEKYNLEYDLVKSILIDILPDVNDIRLKPVNENNSKILVEVETSFGWVNLRDLSFGYQTLTALIVDIASNLLEKYPESKKPLEEPVIILIDEIDLHLHPKWQRTVIEKLSRYFPNAQFIVTAHSPLIVQAAQDRNANIVVCRKEGDKVVIDNNPESVKGWRIDQILTSDLFELTSTKSVEMESFRNEKINILLKNKLSKKDKERLQNIDKSLNVNPIYSDNEANEAAELIKKAAELLKK